jgi:hypothetical protein
MTAFDAVDGSPRRHVSATEVIAAGAVAVLGSQAWKRSQPSVSTSQSQSFRSVASMRRALLLSAVN